MLLVLDKASYCHRKVADPLTQAENAFFVCAEKLHLISSNRILLQRVIINCWEEGKWWYLGKAADGTVMCRLSFPRHAISLIVY